jgi:hypothetical protein
VTNRPIPNIKLRPEGEVPRPKPPSRPAASNDELTKIIDDHEVRIKDAEGFMEDKFGPVLDDNNGLRVVLLYLLAELTLKKHLTASVVAEMLRAAAAVAGTGRNEVDDLARKFKDWSTGCVGARPRP